MNQISIFAQCRFKICELGKNRLTLYIIIYICRILIFDNERKISHENIIWHGIWQIKMSKNQPESGVIVFPLTDDLSVFGLLSFSVGGVERIMLE